MGGLVVRRDAQAACTSCSRSSPPTLAGAVWAGIAGLLKATVGANEVISTIMLNWIAIWVGGYLFGLGGPLQNGDRAAVGAGLQRRRRRAPSCHVFWGDPELQGLHIGLFIALAALLVFWVVLNRSTTGYEVRAVGLNPEAARYGGISVARNYLLVMAVCGVFAGLAGAMDVLGWQFRIATNDIHDLGRSASSGSPSRCSGATRPVGTVLAALLFGALLSGTSQRNLDPTIFEPELASNLTMIIQGLVVLIVSADVIVLTMLRCGRGDASAAGSAVLRRAGARGPRPREHRGRHRGARARRAAAPRRLGRHRAGRRRLVHRAAAGRCAHAGALDRHRPARHRRRRVGDRGRRARLGWGAVAAGVIGGGRRGGLDAVGRR